MNVVNNIAIIIYTFSIWYFIGIGFVVALLPRRCQRVAFLVSPLIGMCLLTIVGFFEITCLLTPLSPRINAVLLGLLSLLLCLRYWRSAKQVCLYSIQKPLNSLWLVLLALLLMYAFLFHNGFHLLVGSSDQLQYCLDAKQILEEMNTGSINDIPVARYDHYVYDVGTRNIPYAKAYRRGADIMLATTKSLSGLSYQEAFPVLVICAFLTLGLSLGFLGLAFLNFSIFTCLILQLTFLSSFYLILIHLTGSLALIMSLGSSLVALAFIWRVVRAPSWRWQLLAAIVVAAYFSTYSEIVPVNALLPISLMVMWQWRRSWPHFFSAIKRLSFVFLLVLMSAPYALNTILFRIIDNLQPIISAFFQPHLATEAPSHSLFTFLSDGLAPQWTLASVILGAISYYDSSAINAHIAVFVADTHWVSPAAFFIFCGIGVFGLFKNKTKLALFYAAPLLLWPLIAIIMAGAEDSLRFARSLYYPMPFALIGMVALTNNYYKMNRRFDFSQSSFIWAGRIMLASFILVNIFTSTRSFYYLVSHDIYTDPLISRFDERSTLWVELRNELHSSELHQAPVLISGFHDTIRPLIVVSNIPNQSHVVGASILSFWPIYNSFSYQPSWSDFNTRLSKRAYDAALQEENKHRTKDMVLNLIKYTEQAVVPVGNGIPVEWQASSDIYPVRIRRFPNICDVIYRNEYSVLLPRNITTPLKRDTVGAYRQILKSGPITIKERYDSPMRLTLFYEGRVGHVKVKVGEQLLQGMISEEEQKWVKIVAVVPPKDMLKLRLLVTVPSKLRRISWESI